MIKEFEELNGKIVIVEQTGSIIGTTDKQKANLKGLGLRGVGSKSELKCTAEVYGMLYKVSHLINVKIK